MSRQKKKKKINHNGLVTYLLFIVGQQFSTTPLHLSLFRGARQCTFTKPASRDR